MLVSKKGRDLAKSQEMNELLNATLQQAEENRIIKGMVLEVRPTEVLIDVGGKSEGSVPANEFEDIASVKVGQEVDVLVLQAENEDGMVVLSKKMADDKIRWEAVLERYSEGCTVNGTVKSKVRGGLLIDVDGVEAFLPGSQIDVSPVHSTDDYLGQQYEFKLIKISNDRRNIILSRRELIEERQSDKRRELLATLEVGQRRIGKVKNITDFGAFIDLGGADGLLHISEMSWGRVENPKKVFKVGDVVTVLIKEFEGNKIALSMKFEDANPWKDSAVKYAVGNVVTGKVARMTDFGAFVELENGVDALLHVSQISKDHIEKPADVLKVGEEVTAKVVDFNEADKKISLSIKAMLEPEKKEEAPVAEDADVVDVDIEAVIAQENDAE